MNLFLFFFVTVDEAVERTCAYIRTYRRSSAVFPSSPAEVDMCMCALLTLFSDVKRVLHSERERLMISRRVMPVFYKLHL